ncbi:MAG: aldose 1-epimerase [Blastocatellia bacterium]|nr:aldose 1-epimerase [Blastocatellia bacterium]
MNSTYTVETSVREGVEIITLRQDETTAEIAPALGNNCFAFQTGWPVLETVGFADFLKKPTSYGIPILFPYPNRIADGVFHFQGKAYPVNPNRHGYVRDKAWKLIGTGASASEGAWMTAAFDARDHQEAILQQFPFPFYLTVTYRLRENTLWMETEVRNVGESVLPFGFGIHPYFTRPEQGTLQVPARKRWELADSLPTGTLLDVDETFDLQAGKNCAELVLDDIYTEVQPDTAGNAVCRIEDRENGTSIQVSSNVGDFPHIVAYTAPAPRQALCIEPYTCPTDGFNLQERGIESNILVLPPGQSKRLVIAISGN